MSLPVTNLLDATNVVAALLNAVIAVLIITQFRRLEAGANRIAIVLVAFFVFRMLDRLIAKDSSMFPYNASVDLAVNVVLIVLLVLLALDARKLVAAIAGELKRCMRPNMRVVTGWSWQRHSCRSSSEPITFVHALLVTRRV